MQNCIFTIVLIFITVFMKNKVEFPKLLHRLLKKKRLKIHKKKKQCAFILANYTYILYNRPGKKREMLAG